MKNEAIRLAILRNGTRSVLVETHALTKQYREVVALNDCNLSVAEGEVFGLLGPNGAGKTTLLRLILGYLRPTSGTAQVDGLDCHHQTIAVRSIVSYLPGEARLFRQMRGRKVLQFFAEVRTGGDFRKSVQLAERFELDLSRRVAFMSTGMRQKLALAATLAADTPLVILDEPTSNLDPTVRGIVLDMVAEARRDGRTIVFSSHVLSEIEQVCDRVAFLRAGSLVHVQAINELKRRHRITAQFTQPLPPIPEALMQNVTLNTVNEDHVTIETAGELAPVLKWLANMPLSQMSVEPVGLRTLYDRLHDGEVV